MNVGLKGLLLVAAVAGPLTAHATLVNGDTITYQGYASTTNPTTPYGALYTYVGGSAAESFDGVGTLSSSGNVITIDYTAGFSAPACAPHDSCLEGGFFTVGGQTVTAATLASSTVPGLVAANVGAASGGAFINLEGLTVAAGEVITFDVNAAPVPLPAALPLLLSGLGGLGTLLRRRKSAQT